MDTDKWVDQMDQSILSL